jgi:uncharacterized membrane protein YhiD involved in acid resistance
MDNLNVGFYLLAVAVINVIGLVSVAMLNDRNQRRATERAERAQRQAIIDAAEVAKKAVDDSAAEQKRVTVEAAEKIIAEQQKMNEAIDLIYHATDGANSKLTGLVEFWRAKFDAEAVALKDEKHAHELTSATAQAQADVIAKGTSL